MDPTSNTAEAERLVVRVGVRALRENLTRYLREVRNGTQVLVTSRDLVIAELRAPTVVSGERRRLGTLKGKIWMADDFDTVPEDMLGAMEE